MKAGSGGRKEDAGRKEGREMRKDDEEGKEGRKEGREIRQGGR
jgi:hypothetical protein